MTKTAETSDQQAELLDPGKPSLHERAAEIDRKYGRVAKTMQCALQRWIALGHELIAAQRQVRKEQGPKQWLKWLEENTDVKERTSQQAIGFAKRENELRQHLRGQNRDVADLSIHQASQILKRADKAREAEGGNGDPNDDNPDPENDKIKGNGADADGEDGNGDEDEDDPDARQFEALREAYEDADELVREEFHEHLKEVYGLEVRPVQDQQQPEQPDDSAAAA
jgi:hypothetical protein